jgi:hypothetical protein
VSDGDLLEALERSAERESTTPEKLLDRIKATGRDAVLRRDLRLRRAVDVLVEHATPIEMDKAKAREQIWTPGKDREGGAGQLWTPGDDPPGQANR